MEDNKYSRYYVKVFCSIDEYREFLKSFSDELISVNTRSGTLIMITCKKNRSSSFGL